MSVTRETDRFTVTVGNGDMFRVIQYTEFAEMHSIDGVREFPGKVWYETDQGHGVNSLGGGLFSVPSLGVQAVDNRSVQAH